MEQERHKRAELEAHNQSLIEKMKLMEEQFARQQEIITNLKLNNQSAIAAPLAMIAVPTAVDAAAPGAPPAAVASPARTMSPAKLALKDKFHALAEDSPLIQRSMEDLIHDLGGGACSPDEDDDEVAGGAGRYRGSLLLVQKKEGIPPLKVHNTSNNVGRPTMVVSPRKQMTCSSVEKKKTAVSLPAGEGRSAFSAPASPFNSDPSADEEENTPPAQVDDGKDANEGGGLFTLFRGLPSRGGGKEGETSGETMVDDNESNSIVPSDGKQGGGEEIDGDGMEMELDGDDGSNHAVLNEELVKKELAVYSARGALKRDSLGLDGPEPFQSQSSNS